jgi:hypothetical protein
MSTHFKTEKPTRLAMKIASLLFTGTDKPSDFKCMSTGVTFEGSHSYRKVVTINQNAVGAHYLVFGFYYLLCFDPKTKKDYIAIHGANNSKLVAVMDKIAEVKVLIRDAKASS